MNARRLLGFILLNILVSAAVVLGILYWWDNRQVEPARIATGPILVPTEDSEVVDVLPVEEAATPEPEPTVEADDLPRYTVQAGDTLGKISAQFDVPVADILLMNGIDNQDYLQVDQELIIPVGGIPTATPIPTASPLPLLSPTPISFELPEEGEAIIEIGQVINAGILEEETISIINTGTRPIALLGWQLRDSQGHTYTFGQVTLFGEGAAITIHTGQGQPGPGDLYWGYEEPVWEAGESVTLVDAEGTGRAVGVVENLTD